MMIKLKVINIEEDYIYLQNKDGEELKVKKEKLSEDIKIDDELKLALLNEEDQKDLGKEILNEILNTSDNK
jgi:hypothetical protein